jgi:hypothetical protein
MNLVQIWNTSRFLYKIFKIEVYMKRKLKLQKNSRIKVTWICEHKIIIDKFSKMWKVT